MNRLLILSGWLFVLIVSKGLTQTSSPSASNVCTDEDYAIFSAALGNQKVDSLVILDHTAATENAIGTAVAKIRSGDESFYKDVPKEAKDDFEARNKNRVEIDVSKIKAPFETLSLSDEEAEKLLHRKDGWDAFHQKYPRSFGLVSISRPGINHQRDRALLYIGESCGPVCAGGELVLLSKADGKWKVINTASIWTS
jgi:hypothetical protein